MLLLLEFESAVVEYTKVMPEKGVAEELNFEIWGKGFYEKMVSPNTFS